MGRETVFTPVEWPSGGWPTFAPVRGIEQGNKLRQSLDVKGDGPFIARPDDVDFTSGSKLPRNFVYWHWPQKTAYVVSPLDHPGTLQLTPSSFSITDGYKNITAGYDIGHRTLVARKQTDTLFQYSVDVEFTPTVANEEVGVTAYLNQVQSHALGIVNLPNNASINATAGQQSALYFRFITSSKGSLESLDKSPILVAVPEEWKQSPIRLYIQAQNETHYTFSAASTKKIFDKHVIALGEASTLSGGQGDFTGTYRMISSPLHVPSLVMLSPWLIMLV
jgi:beta-xylosidase